MFNRRGFDAHFVGPPFHCVRGAWTKQQRTPLFVISHHSVFGAVNVQYRKFAFGIRHILALSAPDPDDPSHATNRGEFVGAVSAPDVGKHGSIGMTGCKDALWIDRVGGGNLVNQFVHESDVFHSRFTKGDEVAIPSGGSSGSFGGYQNEPFCICKFSKATIRFDRCARARESMEEEDNGQLCAGLLDRHR